MLYYNLSRKLRRRKILIVSVFASFTLLLIVFLNSDYSPDLYFINFGPYEDVSCHYVREGDALPSLDQRYYPSSIFFHETSCNGRLNSRQACSVESAARAHPNWQIHVLFSAPVSKLGLEDVNIENLKMLKNVYFSRVHILDYSKGTPLEELISGGALNRTRWPTAHTSDILRFLTLYKWGGIYLDLDMIVVKPLEGLERSWAAREGHAQMGPDALIGSAALSFYRDRIGSFVADMVVRQACSVESAARAHPNWQIHVLFSAPVSKLNLEDVNIELLKMLKNVYFSRVHILDYSKGTPLDELVSGGALNKSEWPIPHTSDILRFLTLYKWGGIYLDLDIMVVKPLDGLERSWAARENHELIGSAALSFYKDQIGTFVAESAVRELAKSFRGDVWGHNGPHLITRVLKKICSTDDVTQMNARKCLGFEVYDPESFYHIKWEDASYYFEPGVLNNSEAYIYHVWNKISHNIPVRNDSRYANLARRYCPTVYQAHPEDFGNLLLDSVTIT